MGGRTFKCSTSHYICPQVSKFHDPWNNMTVGCFNAPAPHIPSWTNADTARLFFIYVHVQPSSITQASNNSCNSLTEGAINKMSLHIVQQYFHTKYFIKSAYKFLLVIKYRPCTYTIRVRVPCSLHKWQPRSVCRWQRHCRQRTCLGPRVVARALVALSIHTNKQTNKQTHTQHSTSVTGM